MSASYTTASRSNSFTNGEQLTVAAGSLPIGVQPAVHEAGGPFNDPGTP